MTAKMSASLPKDDRNGLAALSGAMVAAPENIHVAIVTFDCAAITTNVDTGDVVPTARIRAIEPISSSTADATEMLRLLRRAYERRTGNVELPLELEREFDEITPSDE